MKKVKVKKTKYGLGGSTKDPLMDYFAIQQQRLSGMPNGIENPNTALTDNNIRLARATQKANDNGWTTALDIFGNLAMQVGGSLMNQGMSNGQGVSKGGFDWGSLMQQGIGSLSGLSQMAYGGSVPKIPVEVEGEEVGETPDGNVMKFKGPSHENGGIDINLPEGTEMFSKRIKIDGVSIADRKAKREKRTLTLEKLLEGNPTDKFTQNTLSRTKQVNDSEDEFDKNVQEVVKGALSQHTKEQNHLVDINDKQKFQGGGTVLSNKGNMETGNILSTFLNLLSNGGMLTDNAYGGYGDNTRPSLATPGIVADSKPSYSITGKKLYSNLKYDDVYDEVNRVAGHLGMNVNFDDPNSVKAYQKAIGIKSTDGKFGKGTFDATKNYLTPITNLKPAGIIEPEMKIPELDLSKMSTPTVAGSSTTTGETGKGFDFKNILGNMTTGDIIGMLGNYVSTFGPMKNTLENRAGDTPNINAFKDYGKDGLKAVQSEKQYIDDIRDEQLQDLELSRTGAIKRNRNSARGINTQRALDLATDSGINDTKANIYTQFANQMMSIIAQQAQMENQQDQVVMQGEQNRDLADRQDRDNFFTQMAQDIATKGQGLQETGYDINKIKERNVIDNLLKQLSKYGISVDSSGNLTNSKK